MQRKLCCWRLLISAQVTSALISSILTLSAISLSWSPSTASAAPLTDKSSPGGSPSDSPESTSDSLSDSQSLIHDELSGDLDDGAKPGDTVEAPPPAEYPYPGASEEGYQGSKPNSAKSSRPSSRQQDTGSDSAPPMESRRASAASPQQSQRPKSIAPDGTYIYDTNVQTRTAHPAPGIEAPVKVDAQGQYFYKDLDDQLEAGSNSDIERPTSINSKGDYVYNVPRKKANRAASFRFGMLTPPEVINSSSDSIKFSDIYGTAPLTVLLVDYEWRLTSKVGRLGIKFTTGISTAAGKGRFATYGETGRPSADALEKFTFITFPNQLTAIYKFQYSDTQIFVPYVEGGGGYFTFAELRDDNKDSKFGGAPTLIAAGGANLLLDWIDKQAIHQLDADYGVSHIWLTGEYRQIVGLNKNIDFTSGIYNLGFLMEF